MNDRWRTGLLGDLCDVRIGKTPARSETRYWGSGHRWLSIADMDQGRLITTTSEEVTDAAVDELNLRLVPPGTLLLSFKLSIGKVGVANAPLFTNEAIAHLPIRDDRIERSYLYWALRTMPLTTGADRAAMGTTLNKSKLKQIPVPLPPIEEQRRIAAVLDAADALRAKRRRAFAKLDTVTQAIFIDMFGGEVERVIALGEFADVQGGLQVSSKRRTNPIEVPYLRVANSFRGFMDLTEVKTIRITPRELDRTRLRGEDLLVVEGHGNKDEIGRVALWNGAIDPCVHQNHLIRVRCDRIMLLPRFVETFMNGDVGRRALLRAANTTSGLNTISTSDVRAVQVPSPPRADQQRFVDAAALIDLERDRLEQSAKALDALFASLQQRAFRGEL